MREPWRWPRTWTAGGRTNRSWPAGPGLFVRRPKRVGGTPPGRGGVGVIGACAATTAALIWGFVAMSYNAELADSKQKLETANRQLGGLNDALQETTKKLDGALERATKEKNDADHLRGTAEKRGEQ